MYSGAFDGNGKSVSGVYINQSFVGRESYRSGYIGLFGNVQGGSIQNVILLNSFISGTAWNGTVEAGGIVGSLEDGTLSGCSNSGTISAAGSSAFAGGIAGMVLNAAVSGCTSNGSISASGQSSYYASSYAGGIVGDMKNTTLDDCTNSGGISASSILSAYVGGVAGYGTYSTISVCGNSGDVLADATYVHAAGISGYAQETTIRDCTNSGSVTSEDVVLAYTGGIAGWAWYAGVVTGCENSGDVTVTASDSSTLYICAGGVVGRTHCGSCESRISECVSSGDIVVTAPVADDDYVRAGGIVGFVVDIPVNACANTGDVTIVNKNSADCESEWEASVGGVAGYAEGETIYSCYSAGTVAVSGGPASYVGSIVGNLSEVTIETCYYLTGTADGGVGSDSEGTDAEEKTAAEFASGNVCYLLNGESTQNVTWYQTIGSDPYPVLDGTHDIVYQNSDGTYDAGGTDDTDTGNTGTGNTDTGSSGGDSTVTDDSDTGNTDSDNTHTHTWDEGVVTLAATRVTEGEKTCTCTVCGETTTENIPVLTGADAEFLFDDVTSGDAWYYDAVYWAYDLGITAGYEDGTFRPNSNCTRAEFATFLYTLARAYGVENAGDTASRSFTDVAEGSWYYTYVMWAAENGLVSGYSDGTFKPNKEITRAEAVTMLYNFYKYFANGGEDPVVECENTFSDVSEGSWYYHYMMWAVQSGVVTGYTDGTCRPNTNCTRAVMVVLLYATATNLLEP